MRSYVTIHLSIVLAVGVLVTGSIWARASWGHWFVWDEPMLVVFLIVFLLYATYQPLRFSIEDPEKQSLYASVFAIMAGAFVPLCFGAVRMAQNLTHPQTGSMTTHGPGSVTLTFLTSLTGMTLLFVTLCKYEMASKNATSKLRSLRRRIAGDDDFAGAAGRSAAPQL
jgi:heme exporter protein C